MSIVEWRNDTDVRIDRVEGYQRRQSQIWWGLAASVGSIVLVRFIAFVLDSGLLTGLGR
jgi:hypothetical protein